MVENSSLWVSCKIIADLLSGLEVLKIYSLNCFLVLNFLLKMSNLCPLHQCDWAVVNFVSPPSFLSCKRSSSSAARGQVNRPQFGTWTVSLRREWWSTRIINTLHHKHTLTLSHQLEASRWTPSKHYYTTQVWHYSAVTFSLCTREQKPLTGTTLMTTLQRLLFDTTYRDQTPNTSKSLHSIFFYAYSE